MLNLFWVNGSDVFNGTQYFHFISAWDVVREIVGQCVLLWSDGRIIPVNEQDMQCMYNVTMRCVHATIVAVEDQCVLHNLSVYL